MDASRSEPSPRLARTRESAPPASTSDALDALSDEDLLRHAADGDQEAVAVLFDRYQGLMYGLALRITADPPTAQDVVQDAFVGVWRNAGRFDAARASARSWMLAIAHHRAVDVVRRRRPTADLAGGEAALPAALVAPDIWTEVRQRLDAGIIRQALARLAPLQREAIELAYFQGLTQVDIAARTQAPLGTVKSRVRLGLLALRTEIEALERSSPPQATGIEPVRWAQAGIEPALPGPDIGPARSATTGIEPAEPGPTGTDASKEAGS